jgi:hypothetical protein
MGKQDANHVDFSQNVLPTMFFFPKSAANHVFSPECAAKHVFFQNVLLIMFFPQIVLSNVIFFPECAVNYDWQ